MDPATRVRSALRPWAESVRMHRRKGEYDVEEQRRKCFTVNARSVRQDKRVPPPVGYVFVCTSISMEGPVFDHRILSSKPLFRRDLHPSALHCRSSITSSHGQPFLMMREF